MNSFEKDDISLKCKIKVIEVLIEENRIEEAAPLATKLANIFRNPRRIMFREVFENIADKLDDGKKEEFLCGLDPVLRDRLWARNRKVSANTEPPKVKKQSSAPVIKQDDNDIVKKAFAENDIAGLFEGLKTLQVSSRCRDEIIEQMIDENKLDEAAKVALIPLITRGKALNRQSVPIWCNLLKKWEEAGEVKKTVEFVKNLNTNFGSDFARLLKGDIWVKAGLARTDPSGYLELLKSEAENPKK